ncbi:phage tail protein [Paenibacillus sp. HJGM_3]|uniref:phage tail protein n=1 Tax=Paenibacillus sp. HJGM_3 TaxID=3379816 RepID=UPI00385A4663
MAANARDEFLFLAINHKRAWEQGLLYDLQPVEDGIALREAVQYVADRSISMPDLPYGIELTDVAAGPCQTLYILDGSTRTIYVYDVIERRFDEVDSLRSLFEEPSAIAYSEGWVFAADMEAEHRVLRLAGVNWQLAWRAGAAEDGARRKLETALPMRPSQLAADSAGNVFVLDAEQGCVVKFDRSGRAVVFGQSELDGKQPADIALSGDNVCYVLDRQEKKVLAFQSGTKCGEFQLSLEAPSGLAVDSKGFLYIGESRPIGGEEEDRYIHKFDRDGLEVEVLSAYRGAAHKIVIDECDRMYILDRDNRRLALLRLESTLYKRPGDPLAGGIYYSQALDSTDLAVRWHKLAIDAHIPANTQVEVCYMTADSKTFRLMGKEQDLDVFLHDPDVSAETRVDALNRLGETNPSDWSEPLVNPKELLIRGRTGRYLWLRVKLIGSEKQSPVVKSIRAVFPRQSYLRYLPAVYQDDEGSRDFLERFLSLFETFLTDSEREIDRIARWFDADAVSGEYLHWLASWLAVAYDENWSETQLRELVRHIPALYRKRGTREGIEDMIELFTGIRPYIVEQFQLQSATDPEVKAILEKLYGTDPYSFCVLLKTGQITTDHEYATVKRILDAEKPAHTSAGLTVLQPWVYLDMHSYLGVNSYLTKPSSTIGTGVIQRDTVLTDRVAFGQIDIRSRTNTDTVLA